jgi:Aegerolysin
MSYQLTGSVQNSSGFTLAYQSQSISWGQCEVSANSIPPNQTLQAFIGTSDAEFSGCEGTLTYGFTDERGNQQTVQFYYNDPFSGSNSANITVPNAMFGNANVPSHGSDITANYSLAGQPSLEAKDTSASPVASHR